MNPKIKNTLGILSCVLVAAIIALVIQVIVTLRRVEPKALSTLSNIETAASNTANASGYITEYVKTQTENLNSEKNQKALEAGYQMPAVANGALKLLIKTTIPKANANLDSSNQAFLNLGSLIARLDSRLSDDSGLLPELTRLARSIGTTTESLKDELNALIRSGKLSLDQLEKILSDPAISTAIAKLASAMGHLDGSSDKVEAAMGHFEQAMRDSPLFVKNVNEILAEVKKIAATTNKFAKATIIARIFSLLAGALIP